MKKTLLAVLAACMLTTAVPLMAADTSQSSSGTGQKASKDECLLYAKKCSSSVDSLQDNMRRLNKEIQKGTRVYTVEELQRLENKLKEANDLLQYMTSHP